MIQVFTDFLAGTAALAGVFEGVLRMPIFPFADFAWLLLAQAKPKPQGNSILEWIMPIAPMLVIFVLFYFLLLRPQQQEKAKLQQLIDNLKKNDEIVTSGGLIGTVVAVHKDFVTMRLDESNNTRARVLRSAISRVLSDTEASAVKSADSK